MDGYTTQTNLAAAPNRSEVAPSTGKARWAAAGGILGALAASSCCILPVVLFTLGISGAWIGNLTALAPYQPIFLAATAGCLGARQGCAGLLAAADKLCRPAAGL